VNEPLFLNGTEVLAYHAQQIHLYGGDPELRDAGLLDSALSQPQNTFLYNSQADLYDVAAAYAFHIAKNHPFVDGNKRTALESALGFLSINHIALDLVPKEELYEAMIRLTTSQSGKAEFAAFLRHYGRPLGPTEK
jgi:death on curing protein